MKRIVVWHQNKVDTKDREKLNGHRGGVIWLTGLSGSGKSTIAVELEKILYDKGVHTFILDGDNIRHGLNKDLGFSDQDRNENIRRIAHVAKLFASAGIIVITAFISPFREDRKIARDLLEKDRFLEVYVNCDLETCIERDPKGLYQKALNGEIENFTGISSTYEPPLEAELVIDNGKESRLDENVQIILEKIEERLIDVP